jgi:geranylgeranyl pyrophosphate synthase
LVHKLSQNRLKKAKHMTKKQNQQIQMILSKYGQSGLQTAKENLKDKVFPKSLLQILAYFMEETWPNTHHPALIALCSEAVGGKPELTAQAGAALVLFTGAADIHDDIIDKSKTKSGKPTAYGKFNPELVLLAGDTLLFESMVLLHRACLGLSTEEQNKIFSSMEHAFSSLITAVSSERILRKNPVDPDEYIKKLVEKGTVTQTCAEIGAAFGNANSEQTRVLSNFGKTLGVLMTIKNEFADLYDQKELQHRRKNEILPIPLLYALKDSTVKTQLEDLLLVRITRQKAQKIGELAEKTQAVKNLKGQMLQQKQDCEKQLNAIKNSEKLRLLLDFAVDY